MGARNKGPAAAGGLKTHAFRDLERAFRRLEVSFCADLGGKTLIFGSPNQRSVPPGIVSASGWRLARESLAACADAAEARSVTVCLEALTANLTNLLNTNAVAGTARTRDEAVRIRRG